MTAECKNEYRSFYCGLCHTLKSKYGFSSVPLLSYEMTAFLILLSGLSNETEQIFHGSCTITPFLWVPYIDYLSADSLKAADLSLYIANCEIQDNIRDEGNLKWRAVNALLSRPIKKASSEITDVLPEIEDSVASYYRCETKETPDFFELVQKSGETVQAIIMPLFHQKDKEIQDAMASLIRLIGKWIYLLDACDDYGEDLNVNRFNPIYFLETKDDIQPIIKNIEREIAEIIKKMPFMKHRQLIEFLLIENMAVRSDEIICKFIRK